MALIDSTYFIRDISLDVGTLSNIDSDLTKYERELIESLFNYEDAQDVLDYANPGSDQWVIDVVEGKEYTVDSTTYKWIGLANAEKESLIAYWTYYWHLRNIVTVTGGTGIVKPNHENSINWNAGQKCGVAWIRFEKLLLDLNMFLSNEYEDIEFCSDLGNVNMFDL